MPDQPRHERGTPAGGRFAPDQRAEADQVSLEGPPSFAVHLWRVQKGDRVRRGLTVGDVSERDAPGEHPPRREFVVTLVDDEGRPAGEVTGPPSAVLSYDTTLEGSRFSPEALEAAEVANLVGSYGPDWEPGLLIDHLDQVPERFLVDDGTAIEVHGERYPVVCGDLISVPTEDGPVSGRCGTRIASRDAAGCPGHDAARREWSEMSELDRRDWEIEHDRDG